MDTLGGLIQKEVRNMIEMEGVRIRAAIRGELAEIHKKIEEHIHPPTIWETEFRKRVSEMMFQSTVFDPEHRILNLFLGEKAEPTPSRHMFNWEEPEDISLRDELVNFLKQTAQLHRRRPSAIAFRVARLLKKAEVRV